jgi:hypothetical protein
MTKIMLFLFYRIIKSHLHFFKLFLRTISHMREKQYVTDRRRVG